MAPADWTALGTMLTAVVALLAAGFAAWQVLEIRRTREEQVRPFVIVDILPSVAWANILNLVVENVGTTVAHDVTFTFDPPLRSSQTEYNLSDSTMLREGIPTLPPGRKIEAIFDLSHERLKTDLPMRYQAKVNLKDARERSQKPQRYVIDLTYLYGLTRVDEYGIHHAAKALREIQQLLQGWSTRGGLRVWARDEDHRLEEERRDWELRQRNSPETNPEPGRSDGDE